MEEDPSRHPVSLKVRPTAKLVEEIESPDGKATHSRGEAKLTQNIHMSGPNARINVNSTDNSANIASVTSEQLFVRLRETANTIAFCVGYIEGCDTFRASLRPEAYRG